MKSLATEQSEKMLNLVLSKTKSHLKFLTQTINQILSMLLRNNLMMMTSKMIVLLRFWMKSKKLINKLNWDKLKSKCKTKKLLLRYLMMIAIKS